MAYPKRVYTDGIEDFTYEDANRIETGIETNDIRITELEETTASHTTKLTELDDKNVSQDADINNRVLQTAYDNKMTALDSKNAEQDTAIGNKVNNSTFTAAKTALETAIAGKVLMNGESTNVNFIENKVVQDGLIDISTSISSNSDITLGTVCNGISPNQFILRNFSAGTSGYTVEAGSDSALRVRYYDETGTSKISLSLNANGKSLILNNYTLYKISVVKRKHTFYITVNNEMYISEQISSIRERVGVCESSFGVKFLYNHILSQQEIQHNFSVLNNTPSISSIETTDKTSFLFATDSDHVITPTGHTEEERYTALLSKFGKKFIGTGEDITVENAIENQRVLSVKISGQTVKCLTTKNPVNNGSDIQLIRSTNRTFGTSDIVNGITKNTTYKFIFNVKAMDIVKPFGVQIALPYTDTTGSIVEDITSCNVIFLPTVGTNIVTYTTGDYNYTGTGRLYLYVNMSDVEVSYITLEPNFILVANGDENKVVKNKLGEYKFGLNSAQATITNNGLTYSFYMNIEDKLANRVIDLGGIEGARNTLTFYEDGSATHIKSLDKIVIDGNSNVTGLNTVSPTANTINCNILINNLYGTSTSDGMGDIIPYKKLDSSDTEHIRLNGSTPLSTGFVLYINKTKLTTLDVAGVKSWLQSNPITVCYQITTPIVTYIPKELVPAILTQLKNEFKFGDAVKPSSVEITVPVDKVGDLETRVGQLEKVITSVSNLSLLGNYAEDEYNTAINQL